jgi:segregation and condensation protein A
MEIEESILQTVIEKESWEEIIYFIVSKEKLDPWNIDLVKLTNSFIRFLREIKELDFRIPAKVVFVAALLLKLKAEYLTIFEEVKEEELRVEEEKIEFPVSEIPLPVKRFPKVQVTLEDLIKALKEALAVRERREIRRRIVAQRLQQEIVFEEDIGIRMERLLKEIEELIQKTRRPKIRFKEIVEEWKRDIIIEHLLPLLHLDQEKKVETEQEEFFKDIWISKKG